MGIGDADHEETAPDAAHRVINKLVCSLVGQVRTIRILPGTLSHLAFGKDESIEEFRCNYGLNPAYRERLTGGELKISGVDADGEVRMIELSDHRFFIATLFLPQLSSRPDNPHPLIQAYLQAAMAK